MMPLTTSSILRNTRNRAICKNFLKTFRTFRNFPKKNRKVLSQITQLVTTKKYKLSENRMDMSFIFEGISRPIFGKLLFFIYIYLILLLKNFPKTFRNFPKFRKVPTGVPHA